MGSGEEGGKILQTQLPRQQEQEASAHKVGEHEEVMEQAGRKQSAAVERKKVEQEFRRIERCGLHLADEAASGMSVGIPERQRALLQRSGSKVVPGVGLVGGFIVEQDGELPGEKDFPVEERYREEQPEQPARPRQ